MIDGILYINLSHRNDRKQLILKTLQYNGVDMNKVHRIEGVLNEMCGHLGCGESHIKALETAILNNWKNVLILEDDFVFTQTPTYIHNTLEKINSINWDVVLLAGGHRQVIKSKYSFLNKIIKCSTASGYIVRQHYYKTLLENFKMSVMQMKKELELHINNCNKNHIPITKLHYCSAIDQYWFTLQGKDTFYLCAPEMGKQNDTIYSDNNCQPHYQKKYIENNAKCEKESC